MKKILLAALLVPFLAGCDSYLFQDVRVPVSFATDAAVLRGTYAGTIKGAVETGKTLTLTFTPTYVSDSQYTVAGSGTLNTASVMAAGTVYAGSYKFLKPQMSPVPMAMDLTVTRVDGTSFLLKCEYGNRADVGWFCRTANDSASSFTLAKAIPTP